MVMARKAICTRQLVHSQKVKSTFYVVLYKFLVVTAGIHADKAFVL